MVLFLSCQIGDLTPITLPIPDDPRPRKVYKIWVYNRSKKGRYYTFVTPECSEAIDNYLKFRKERTHEDITKQDSPLIREQFSLSSPRADVNIPYRMTQNSLEKTIERTIVRAGVKTIGSVMLTHGFRKWAITQMIRSKVDYEVREYVSGHRHSRGLDVNYDRTTEDQRFLEWSKCINLLTIDNKAFHLEKQLELIEGETNQRIAQLETRNAKLEEERQQELKKQDARIEDLEDRLRRAGLWDSCD